MENCLFCKIIQKEIPAKTIFENESSIAVLDIYPRSPGHTIVIPKRHSGDILEVPDTDIGGVFSGVKSVVAILKEKLSPDGFTIGINHGEAAGQEVEHLHIHVIPRWNGDGGTSVHGVVLNRPGRTLDEIAENILS